MCVCSQRCKALQKGAPVLHLATNTNSPPLCEQHYRLVGVVSTSPSRTPSRKRDNKSRTGLESKSGDKEKEEFDVHLRAHLVRGRNVILQCRQIFSEELLQASNGSHHLPILFGFTDISAPRTGHPHCCNSTSGPAVHGQLVCLKHIDRHHNQQDRKDAFLQRLRAVYPRTE